MNRGAAITLGVGLLMCATPQGRTGVAGVPGATAAVSVGEPGDQTSPGSRELPGTVERRRAGPAILVHRGATAFALENSLLACALAMRHGADGVEVDVRRTHDGTLVLFHDESVDRVLRGIGRVREHTLRQLETLATVPVHGRPVPGQVARFDDLLDLAARSGMLLHLDLKEPGLEAEVARLLTERGVWPNVVSINEVNAGELRRNPGFHPLRYKVPGLYVGRRDVDPAAITAALAQPGEMILVDDPRVAANVLERAEVPFLALDLGYRVRLPVREVPLRDATDAWLPPVIVDRLRGIRPKPTADRLVEILEASAVAVPDLTGEQRTVLVVTRAWAAGELGTSGRNRGDSRQALRAVLQAPLSHPDPELSGVDAAMAVRALGELGATAAAGDLIRFLRSDGRISPRDLPPAGLWSHWRPRQSVFAALGGLRCGTARRFLWDYVRAGEEQAWRYGVPAYEEATRALMRQTIDWSGIAELLRSPNSTVRGTALLECLDHPTDERRLALRKAASWAVGLMNRGGAIP